MCYPNFLNLKITSILILNMAIIHLDLINGGYVFDKYYDEFNDWLKVFKQKHDIYVDKLYKTTCSKKHYNHLNKLKNKEVNKQVLSALVFGTYCHIADVLNAKVCKGS